jgi:hypothetical protein
MELYLSPRLVGAEAEEVPASELAFVLFGESIMLPARGFAVSEEVASELDFFGLACAFGWAGGESLSSDAPVPKIVRPKLSSRWPSVFPPKSPSALARAIKTSMVQLTRTATIFFVTGMIFYPVRRKG